MVVIVDKRTRVRSMRLRDSFLDAGIPTALCTPENLSSYRAPVTIYFAPDETSLSLVSVRAGRCDLIAVNVSGRHMYNPDAIIYDDGIPEDIISIVRSMIYKRTGKFMNDIKAGDVRITNGAVTFELKYLALTETEKMIVTYLSLGHDVYHSEDRIRKYACRECDLRRTSSSVSAHICNINRKAIRASGRKMILCRRGSGYTILSQPPAAKKLRTKPGFTPPFV